MYKYRYILITLIILLCISLYAYCSEEYCLKTGYEYYKKNFISSQGRVMDPERGNLTTSEGQSYILQRAVAVNDPKTFDFAYKWTKKNLQRRDKLFSWLWDKDKTGKYRVLDKNSASDADVNIAFALILAYERWKDKKYLKEALPIVRSIWRYETRRIGKYRVLMPGAIQARVEKIEINPSYFHPYAFKFFKNYDKFHDWNKLVDSSYYYINASCAKTKTGLSPNWFLIEKNLIVLENSERSDFSYDAIRVFKKAYWDYIRTGDKRALPVLAKSKFFIKQWKQSKMLYTNYKADGTLRDLNEFTGSIAILILPISIYEPKTAVEIYKKKIEPYLFNKENWKVRKDYYTKNLLWFGCHFYYKESSEHKEMGELRKSIF
ncbi:MAG: glycosyl hydrolase family 8 [Candidatus Gastranaerophilales bacterium]|nr:glycosyl hydrolase family 8 [Candidatus Gastranaerophilales bacterium]